MDRKRQNIGIKIVAPPSEQLSTPLLVFGVIALLCLLTQAVFLILEYLEISIFF